MRSDYDWTQAGRKRASKYQNLEITELIERVLKDIEEFNNEIPVLIIDDTQHLLKENRTNIWDIFKQLVEATNVKFIFLSNEKMSLDLSQCLARSLARRSREYHMQPSA